jgi:hypothetical protein
MHQNAAAPRASPAAGASHTTEMTAKPDSNSTAMIIASHMREHIRDRLRVPLPATRRGDPSRVECLRNFPECPCARLLRLADDWQHVRRVPVGFGLHGVYGALAGHMEPGIARGTPRACS